MAKRRRSRGFGSSAAEHTKRAESAGHNVSISASESVREANAGQCGRALTHLNDAHSYAGREAAEYAGAGKGFRANSATYISDAETVFRRACLVKR